MEAAGTFILRGFVWWMEPPEDLQNAGARQYDRLRPGLEQAGQLDCVRNFLSVHVCSTITLTTVLALEFFISGFFALAELTDAVKAVIELNNYEPLFCVDRVVRDLAHMVKLAVFGTFMIFLCFVAPKKVITLFHTRVSPYRTTGELEAELEKQRAALALQASRLEDAEAEVVALRAWCQQQGHEAPPVLDISPKDPNTDGRSDGE